MSNNSNNNIELDSYPLVLRPFIHTQSSNPNSDSDPNPDTDNPIEPDWDVPVIDLESLRNEEGRKKLDEACKDWGALRLVNHGVPHTLLREIHEKTKEVFGMPFELKQASFNNNGNSIKYFWGTPALTTSGDATQTKSFSLMEGLNVPLAQQPHFQYPLLHSFRVLLGEYGDHLYRIATTLFDAMVENLNLKLEGSKTTSYVAENTGFLRVYRYPQSRDPNIGLGLEAHTDSSVVSILTQEDPVNGLQVLRDDTWLTLKPIPNTLFINIGDMMQAISEDKYISATHRVKVTKAKERISICYFVFPGEEAVIHNSKYKPFTHSDFRSQVEQDIATLGFKVGLPRFYHPNN